MSRYAIKHRYTSLSDIGLEYRLHTYPWGEVAHRIYDEDEEFITVRSEQRAEEVIAAIRSGEIDPMRLRWTCEDAP